MEFKDDSIGMLDKEDIFNTPEQLTCYTVPGFRILSGKLQYEVPSHTSQNGCYPEVYKQ